MPSLIIDIETIGEDFDQLDLKTQESLTNWLKKESFNKEDYNIALENLKNGLGFSPLTGKIVALGALDCQTNKGQVLFSAPGKNISEFCEDNISYIPADEKEILERFWEGVKKYDQIITFNGRAFDIPFIIIRSAINKVKISKNLMRQRFLAYQPHDCKHIDLMDELSFYGTVRKKGNLHLFCRAYGINSPKTGGVTGDDVGQLFKQGEFLEIAKYNARDLEATLELFDYWCKYINVF